MNEEALSAAVVALERIGMVLGALYASQLGEMEQKQKAERLERCGLSNSEIADLLGSTSESIRVALHKLYKGKSKVRTIKKRA